MDSSTVLPHATTILDLNDDCLIEVCRHMNPMDLSAFADVCGRFRSSAQAFFAISEHKNLDMQEFYCRERLEESLRMSRLLRNFGASIVKMFNSTTDCDTNHLVLIELLLRYCGENLIDFELVSCSLTDEITLLMRPLLERLQKLSFINCAFESDTIISDVLPLWTLELRELKLDQVSHGRNGPGHFRYFQLQFPKLTKLSLHQVSHRWIFEFLALNSQLEELELDNLQSDGCMLEFIAVNLTQISRLKLSIKCLDDIGIKYLGAMRNLSSLEVEFDYCYLDEIVSAIRTMGETNVPLKRLKVPLERYWGQEEMAAEIHLNDFVEAVSSLKKLEALSIDCDKRELELNAAHINYMSKHLTQLTELDLITREFLWTAENILECVRNAKNLQSLKLKQYADEEQTICLDVDFFNKMVNLLEKQGKQRCLSIKLKSDVHTKNIPYDLTRAKRHVLLISISGLYN